MDYAGETERLRRELSHHLRDRPLSDADNWRLQNELGWQDDRGNLLRFLDEPTIAADEQSGGAGAAWSCDSEEGLALLQECKLVRMRSVRSPV